MPQNATKSTQVDLKSPVNDSKPLKMTKSTQNNPKFTQNEPKIDLKYHHHHHKITEIHPI